MNNGYIVIEESMPDWESLLLEERADADFMAERQPVIEDFEINYRAK